MLSTKALACFKAGSDEDHIF